MITLFSEEVKHSNTIAKRSIPHMRARAYTLWWKLNPKRVCPYIEFDITDNFNSCRLTIVTKWPTAVSIFHCDHRQQNGTRFVTSLAGNKRSHSLLLVKLAKNLSRK